MNELSIEELGRVNYETQDADEISRIKSEWQKALKQLEKFLDRKLNVDIEYYPSKWREERAGVGITDTGIMWFSTPNIQVNFDSYNSFKSKLFAVAHEKFGHVADKEEYYGGSWDEYLDEYQTFVTPDQRTNLRVAHVIPNELYTAQIELVKRRFKILKRNFAELGKYLIPLALIETLGRMGMRRNDDIPKLLLKIQKVTELPMDNFWYCFAGLSTPPRLNGSKRYGIKKIYELENVQNAIARYLRKKITHIEMSRILEQSNYKTKIHVGYKPEYSVGLTGINNLELALENVSKPSSYWEMVAMHHNTYHAPQDMANALRSIQEKIEKHMKRV
jgi:hypothetical protein